MFPESGTTMITGLQISMRGEELRQKIAERIRAHEGAIAVLDVRIKRREGDRSFDVRVDDGLETLAELEADRQQYRDRVFQLTLLLDSIVAEELYALSEADLRLAELISPDRSQTGSGPEIHFVDTKQGPAIDGLKLTISGEELRALLQRRIQDHDEYAQWWKREETRTPEDQTEDEPLLPSAMCANEAERHVWRAEVLGFIRDHIDAAQTYRLGESDLAFGDLLPVKPGWLEQQAYEERTNLGFQLERLTKRIGEKELR
jgi:hypothetical protein